MKRATQACLLECLVEVGSFIEGLLEQDCKKIRYKKLDRIRVHIPSVKQFVA